MSEHIKRIPKPEKLRDLHAFQIKRNLFVSITLCALVAGTFYYRNLLKKNDYAEFYRWVVLDQFKIGTIDYITIC
jgi:hypothetical protein